MHHDLEILPTSEALAVEGARRVAEAAVVAADARGVFRFAVSGGRTPWAMFGRLSEHPEFPWDRTEIFQVDERLVPPDHPDRNLTRLQSLVPDACTVHPMPVEESDPEAACGQYADQLPARFDLIHLGLGADGHTASLVPGDSALDERTKLVAVTASPYQGHLRMTLTYPALERAASLLWLVSGADKQEAVRLLLAGDPAIPAGRVRAPRSLVLVDAAARGDA